MGLSSSINFRTSQVDPAAMLSTATSSTGGPDDPGAFERHLDDLSRSEEKPSDRAAAARDDQRQRSDATRRTKRNDDDRSSDDDATDEAANADASSVVVVAQAQVPVTDDKPLDATGDEIAVVDVADMTGEEKSAPALDGAPLSGKAESKDADAPLDSKADAGDTTAADATRTAGADDVSAKGKEELATLIPQADAARAMAPATPAAVRTTDTQATQAAPAAVVPTPHMLTEEAQATGAPEGETEAPAADPDTELAVKPKEGLGHETASQMAEKAGAKDAAQAAPNIQSQTAPAAMAATPAIFPAKPAATGDAALSALSATDAGEGTLPARLSDLQNVGNGNSTNSNTATIRIGTLPGQTQPTQVPAMAIALQIARNLQNGTNRFDIRLDPPEMGRIDVRMEVQRDGTVTAHLTVEKAQTLDLLQRDARALQQALSDAGLQANSDSLNFSLRDQNAGGNARDFAGAQSTSSTGAAATSEEAVVSPIYNVNLSATGGVDIRV